LVALVFSSVNLVSNPAIIPDNVSVSSILSRNDIISLKLSIADEALPLTKVLI
jgi:hypothetical protein